ncbi:MAG: D-2-hydroxyacid dehydrogenase [bacterium]|nr:D-2-hydroxyacid dehydrogenase [bacterium]
MAPRLDVCLRSPIRAFDFSEADLAPLRSAFPALELVIHERVRDLIAALPESELIVTWMLRADAFAKAPALRAVFTPSAGNDWVAEDPAGRVPTHYGTFHGGMMAESLLGLMQHFNRRIGAMLDNETRRDWDRNLQFPGRMLRNQHAVIIGYGQIGRECARLLGALGMSVSGVQRSHSAGIDPASGASYCGLDELDSQLARADHVVLLLPGGDATRGFMNRERLSKMRAGAFIYNFGRGTVLPEADLLEALNEGTLAGAGLDVTEIEPLPADSPLWSHPQVFVMPHSSCVYEEYRALHVEELTRALQPYLQA